MSYFWENTDEVWFNFMQSRSYSQPVWTKIKFVITTFGGPSNTRFQWNLLSSSRYETCEQRERWRDITLCIHFEHYVKGMKNETDTLVKLIC
jgi:hypothetical protein